ncbi:flagellar hook-basal body protein [Melghiribacillus thermohalophilus]|uniref:Flagellar hook-basal body protein n=1 Tax=Melghiribacillus thermohalophilus TaxID=1324956 RepID=A0A4R3NAF1_9BACI|nr:flagellar hook-basal body complex protein [Melghiribacillus thermohalophilus]TCT26432.1 flagellar hook-basal body protein [Melghiribacillus thermohalophilus]
MLRGYYTAASGMLSQQRRQEVLSNNMSNVLTPGYKAEQTTVRAFPEMLIERMESHKLPVKNSGHIPFSSRIGALNTGAYVHETLPTFTQGSLRETGFSTDFAIINGELPDENGYLFFTVENEDGTLRYTRNGNFTVDSEGFLVTSHGHYVLDENGERIQTGSEEFAVNSSGVIELGDGTTANLGIAYYLDQSNFVHEGNSLFRFEPDTPLNARAQNFPFQITQAGNNLAIENGELPDENGGLFFALQNEEGEIQYTQNADFVVDEDGFLTNGAGFYVLNERGGRIQADAGYTVDENGVIQSGDDEVNLAVVYHPNMDELDQAGAFWQHAEPEDARAIGEGVPFQIKQGYLEQSNVNPERTMTEMLRTYRLFEMNQQVLKAYDKSMDLAVNRIAQLR